MMRNTFRYSLDYQDFVNFEKFNLKKTIKSFILLFLMLITFFIFYFYVGSKNYNIIISVVIISVIFALSFFITYKAMPKKRVKEYIQKDNSYLKPIEMTITDNAIETNNLPDFNEAGIVAIYPYSIMNVIYETNDYFYFIICNEAKILPKRAIPDEMRELVFKEIKKNPNCVFVK